MRDWLFPFDTASKKKRAAGLVIFAVLLTLFLLFNRIPKFGIVEGDLEAVSGSEIQCFQGFCIEAGADTTFWSRWWEFSITYLELVAFGMTFAFLVAGVAEAFLFGGSDGRAFSGRGLKGTLKGLIVGPAMTLCSACIVPISSAFRRGGASVEATISIVQGSATMNLPALIMAALVFAPMLSGSRVALSVLGALVIGPLVAMAAGRRQRDTQPVESPVVVAPEASWRDAILEGCLLWIRASAGYLIRLGPIMVVAGFASGLVVQWISPATVDTFLGNNVTGVVVAATIGVLINVPLMFEIPLVAALLLVGMGTAPAATLLFAAAAGGPITFWGLAKVLPRKATATFVGATWGLGLIGGLAVIMIDPLFDTDEIGLRDSVLAARASSSDGSNGAESNPLLRYDNGDNGMARESDSDREFYQSLGRSPVTPFTNIAPTALKNGSDIWPDQVWNLRSGAVVFDYDRDGDHDFYITAGHGHPNFLYRNEGDATFVNVAEGAGVAATHTHGSGAVACDLDNDGYQDLYVGARGVTGRRVDYRSAQGDDDTARELREVIKDRLFVNNRDGTFREITDSAFGDDVNLRSASTVACADVDGDGWLDIYVGNLITEDFFSFDQASHPGHYNVLYRNNGDLTFQEIAESAGVRGPQIFMRDPQGQTVLFEDPETGETYEGYDPTARDVSGNRIGDPTGRTHAVLFFDYDDDGDPDLWVANDGDLMHVFRNDSSPGEIRFTSVTQAMGIAMVGNWMGFAVGDYDGDTDLDLFVTNLGYHPLTRPIWEEPGGDCAYHGRFAWGQCANYLLRNNGTRGSPSLGILGLFEDVARSTVVVPSLLMPPDSLEPSNIVDPWEVPTGLAAYDFGYGATFFDFDNDGDQDLYWLGSEIDRGLGPFGHLFPSAGRMLRGDGRGSFEDITVRARLLDIQDFDYSSLDPRDPGVPARLRELRVKLHENGKGLAHGDFNGDGYVDLIGTNSSGPIVIELFETHDLRGPIFLWLNGGGESHWVTLRLKGRMAIDGTGSNADAIGARVYVKTTPRGEAEPLIQVQEVRAGSSYLSMDSIDLEFGVGAARVIEEVTILWPSGRRQVLNDISVDQVIGITEPKR